MAGRSRSLRATHSMGHSIQMTATLSLASMILALGALAMAAGLGQPRPVPVVARKRR